MATVNSVFGSTDPSTSVASAAPVAVGARPASGPTTSEAASLPLGDNPTSDSQQEKAEDEQTAPQQDSPPKDNDPDKQNSLTTSHQPDDDDESEQAQPQEQQEQQHQQQSTPNQDQASADTNVVDATAAAAAASLVPPVGSGPTAAALHGYPGTIVFAPPSTVLDTAAAAQGFDDPPTYVNPKQFHRILKRREQRKKMTGSDVISYTPRKRTYMHESRHKHAVARKRGVGGRFLSKKKEDGGDDGESGDSANSEENVESTENPVEKVINNLTSDVDTALRDATTGATDATEAGNGVLGNDLDDATAAQSAAVVAESGLAK